MELLSLSIEFLTGNVVAVLLCVVAYMVIGFLWYGPLFGKKWAGLNGISMDKKPPMSSMLEPMGTSIVGAIVQAMILGGLFQYLIPTTLIEAKMIAFVLWLGFTAGTILTNYAYAGKPMQLRLIDVFFPLVTLSAMAAVLFWFA